MCFVFVVLSEINRLMDVVRLLFGQFSECGKDVLLWHGKNQRNQSQMSKSKERRLEMEERRLNSSQITLLLEPNHFLTFIWYNDK